MKIFLDTEYTDFGVNRQLISMGMVADSGEEFYMELPFDIALCNEFVIDNVLPLLGKEALTEPYEEGNLRNTILKWFAIVKRKNEIIEVCTDSQSDWDLLIQVLEYNVPKDIIHINIEEKLVYNRMFEFWEETKLPEHHALYDAKANKHGFRYK